MSTNKSLQIDYDAVKAKVESVYNKIANSSVGTDYDALISTFSESKGEQASAIRQLLRAEKSMIEKYNEVLVHFAYSIKSAALNFNDFDSKIARDMRGK